MRHIQRTEVRLLGLFAAFIGALALLGNGLGPPVREASATGDLTGVSCSDIYLDRIPLNPGAIGPEDLLVGKSLARVEHNTSTNTVTITTATHLGPDILQNDIEDWNGDTVRDAANIADLVPDTGPSQETCQVKRSAAQVPASPEDGSLHQRLQHSIVGDRRPQLTGTVTGSTLTYGTCDFSDALGAWVRQEQTVSGIDKNDATKDFGVGVLYLATDDPNDIGEDGEEPGNPGHAVTYTDCQTVGSIPFANTLAGVGRDASTDHPESTYNAAQITAGNLVIDPNGSQADACAAHSTSNVKDKLEDECADADALADDWDGDGCPDWDELAPYTAGSGQNGNDPFNPHDCDNNLSSEIAMFITVSQNTVDNGLLGILSELPGNGLYFDCIADVQHDKLTNDITLTPFCYQDSPGRVANNYYAASNTPPGPFDLDNGSGPPTKTCPPADASLCGDGKAGGRPPKADNPNANSFMPVGTRYDADAPESGAADGNCNNAVDEPEDNDTAINDGCPAVGPAESACANNMDDDSDGKVNDGCAAQGSVTAGDCADGLDFEGDNATDYFDSGCRQGANAPAQLAGAINKTTNIATFSGCFENVTNVIGPNVFMDGSFDVKTGDGTVDIWAALTTADCLAGPPVTPATYVNAELDIAEVSAKVTTPKKSSMNSGMFAETPAQCGTNNVDSDGDTFVNDGCVPAGGPNAESGAECAMGNNVDEDGDGEKNDGCPPVGPAEAGAACDNGVDDDGDGFRNDGCPAVGSFERDSDCGNNSDDDGDTAINDGCPTEGIDSPVSQAYGERKDTDRDGCDDKREITLTNLAQGGLRDPANPWDLFDVPTGTFPNLARNKAVAAPDFFAVLGRFGSSGDPTLDVFSQVPQTGYHPAFDRSTLLGAPAGGGLGAANGSIAAPDFFAVLGQFGASC